MTRILALALLLTPALTPDVAYVSDLRGTVERRPGPDDPWAVLGLDQGVRLRDELRTGDRSLAELRFVDGTVLALGEKTRLRISLALFDPAQAPPEIRVALLSGDADVRVGAARLVVEGPDGRTRTFTSGDAFRLHLPSLDPLPPGDGVTTDYAAPPPPPPPDLPPPGELGPVKVPGVVDPLTLVPIVVDPGVPPLAPGDGGGAGGGAGGSGGAGGGVAPPPDVEDPGPTGIRVRVRVR
jgi:hypothetical protein